jgi:hypothetical protein
MCQRARVLGEVGEGVITTAEIGWAWCIIAREQIQIYASNRELGAETR